MTQKKTKTRRTKEKKTPQTTIPVLVTDMIQPMLVRMILPADYNEVLLHLYRDVVQKEIDDHQFVLALQIHISISSLWKIKSQ